MSLYWFRCWCRNCQHQWHELLEEGDATACESCLSTDIETDPQE